MSVASWGVGGKGRRKSRDVGEVEGVRCVQCVVRSSVEGGHGEAEQWVIFRVRSRHRL